MKTENGYRKQTIALAEDEKDVMEILANALHGADYDVLSAANGEEALEKIKTAHQMGFPVDLLITDIRMPVMDGLALIERLEESGIYLPVLVLSGYGDKDLLVKLIRMGCKDYLDKPFLIDEFVTRVRSVLEKEERCRHEVGRYLKQVEKDKATFKVETRLKNSIQNIRTRVLHSFFTFDIAGELDDDSAAHLRNMMEEAIAKGNINFLVNFKQATYISSYGMGVIIYLWKSLKESRGTLYLLSGDSRIRRKIEELNLSRVMKVFNNEAEFTLYMEYVQVIRVEE